MQESKSRAALPYLLFAAAAFLVGLYGRFKGLGFAPVSVDEYYLLRSVDQVMVHGLPQFECGGYYHRGVALQYLIASLRWMGLQPELSSRLVCAVASIVTLPAIYLLARRWLSANAALVVVGILCLSVWEIEIARFGRMYAPFQAVFTWYLVYFLKYTVDRDRSALPKMLALTLFSALTWEGAVFLALVNFVPALVAYAESNELKKVNWGAVVAAGVVLALTFLYVTADLRYYSDFAPYPEGFKEELVQLPPSKLDLFRFSIADIFQNRLWAGLFILPVVFIALATRYAWYWRSKPLAACGLLLILAGALLHQFAIVLAVALLLLLLKQLTLRDLAEPRARVFIGAVVFAGIWWIAYAAATIDWAGVAAEAGGTRRAIAVFAYQLIRFPDVIGEIVRPFADAVPLLSVLLFAGLAISIWRHVGVEPEMRTPERLLLLVVILLALGVGIAHPPRHETRYVAFLYPVCILILVSSVAWLSSFLGDRARVRDASTAIVALLLFCMTEDFSLHHVYAVDSPEITFRTNMSSDRKAHLEIRDDIRGVAAWLREHVDPAQDIVINGVHGMDYYYDGIKYFFADQHDENYPTWACRAGTVDRWTNLPLLGSFDALKSTTDRYRNTYLIAFTPRPDGLQVLADHNAHVVMTEGLVSIVALNPAGR
jgi:hypothetical protein